MSTPPGAIIDLALCVSVLVVVSGDAGGVFCFVFSLFGGLVLSYFSYVKFK